MHIHPNQINLNAGLNLNAFCEMQKVAAEEEAKRVRKKLVNCPSEVDDDCDSYVAKAGEREDSQQQADPQNQQNHADRKRDRERTHSESAENSISDWA